MPATIKAGRSGGDQSWASSASAYQQHGDPQGSGSHAERSYTIGRTPTLGSSIAQAFEAEETAIAADRHRLLRPAVPSRNPQRHVRDRCIPIEAPRVRLGQRRRWTGVEAIPEASPTPEAGGWLGSPPWR